MLSSRPAPPGGDEAVAGWEPVGTGGACLRQLGIDGGSNLVQQPGCLGRRSRIISAFARR